MTHFRAFFLTDFKRFFCKRNLVYLLIIFGLSVWFVVDGVNEYKGSLAKDSEFRELQVDDFGIFRNYHEYSVVGLKSKMGQTPMTFLRNGENSISGLSAKFNTATILEVSKNYKGKGMFEDESYSFFSNIGLILYAVSLLLMFFGFETVRHKHYIKLLDSMSGKSKIFVHAVLPNAVLLALTLFALFTAMYSIVTVLGITLSGNELVNFLKLYLVTTLKLCFFYFLGVVVGSKSSKGNKVLPIMLLWLIFVFLIPGLVNYIVKKRADRISSDYLLAIEKLTVVKDFEKNAVKKAGKFDKTKMDVERNLVEGFYSQDAKRVYELEVALRKEMVAVTDTSFKLSLLIPTTFFKATWRETSGLGYQNVLNYYKFVQDMQRQFLRFFIDRLYYNDPKVLVNFIKKDENIYYAQSLSHPHFWTGIGISLLFNIVLFFLGMNLFERSLYPSLKKPDVLKAIDIDIYPENCTGILSYESPVFPQILNVFFGKSNQFPGKICYDETSIVNDTKEDFIYLPNPDTLPGDLKARDFITLISTLLKLGSEEIQKIEAGFDSETLSRQFENIKSAEKANLLLNLAEAHDFKTFILHNISNGSDSNYTAEVLTRLSRLKEKKGAIILFSEKVIASLTANVTFFLYSENGIYEQDRTIDGTARRRR